MDIEARIARRLKSLRIERAWSLDELAERSGVSRAMISRIERLESSPTAGLLAKLADTFKVSLSFLMAEMEDPGRAISRRDAQLQWRDPETGYVRRLVSPPGADTDTDIVAIELPPGARVPYAPVRGTRWDQQVLVIEGSLHLEIGGESFDLGPGDCARVALAQGHAFCNHAAAPARYLVVARKDHAASVSVE